MANLAAGLMGAFCLIFVWMGFFPEATADERRRWWIAAAIFGVMPAAYAFKIMFLS
jgi:hypothetical protein